MDYHIPEPPAYISKVKLLDQAIFYCYNASSEKIPVGMMHNFTFKDDNTLSFNTNYFPITEMAWTSFAAELHFYKKEAAGSCILHGIAVIDNSENFSITFTIQHAEYANTLLPATERNLLSTLFKPYINFYRKGSELLMQPFRRKTTTGVFQ